MKPNYVATKSAWRAVTFWRVVLFWLVIPLVIMIIDIVAAKRDVLEFYDDKVIHKSGILAKNETQTLFTGVMAVSVAQSVVGRMFNFGDVRVDVQGKWDIDTDMISNPFGLKQYLETKTVKAASINYIEHS